MRSEARPVAGTVRRLDRVGIRAARRGVRPALAAGLTGALLASIASAGPVSDRIHYDGFEAPPACAATTGGSTSVAPPQLIATLEDSFHESWLASPAVADLTGDGTPEIIAARSSVVLGWHLNGDIVFRGTITGSRVWSSPVVADLVPGNPGLEVAVAGRDRIYLWNSAAQLMPGFPHVWRDELRSIAAGDIDGDGDLELVVSTTQRLEANGQRDLLYAVHHTGTPVVGFPPNTSGAAGCTTTCFVTGGFDQNIALGNVDADPALEIFAGHDNAYLSLHDGDGRAFDANAIFNNRDKISGVRGMHDYAEAQQGYADDEDGANQAHFTNSAATFADVDADGVRELIILGSVQNAAQTDRERGVALWALRPDGTRPPNWLTPYHVPAYLAGLNDFDGTNIVGATNQVSVADIDPARPGPEFVFAGFDGRIHAVDATRSLVWSHTYTTDARVLTGGVAIGDLSGDGRPEIVFASYSPDTSKSHLFVLDAGGARLHTIALPDRGAMSVPTLADADADGVVDIVVNLKDGVSNVRQVLVFEVAGARDNCLLWPTARGNPLRNGSPP